MDTAEELEISLRVAVDIYQCLREVWLFGNPMILSGPIVGVDIDESLFRHEHKVHKYAHNKYHNICIFIAVIYAG